MIFDINEENLDWLAISACPIDMNENRHDDECMLLNDEVYYGEYNGSCVDTCRACWMKWIKDGE